MVDNLEEAILHHEEIVEKNEADINSDEFGKYYKEYCLESAEYNRQLAEWLRELKAYKEAEEKTNPCDRCQEFDCYGCVYKER